MNIEFLIVQHKKFGEPVAFIKKPNKIYVKKSRNKEKLLETLIVDCFSLSKYFEGAILNIDDSVLLSENVEKIITENNNIDMKNSVSAELLQYVGKSLSEIENPTKDELNVYMIENEGQVFIVFDIKAGIKRYSVVRHKRLSESPNKLFNRMLQSLIAKESFNNELIISVSHDEMKKWFSVFHFNKKNIKTIRKKKSEEAFFIENKNLIENKMKSTQNNEMLKQKHIVNEEDAKSYNNSVIIYTDGAVFPDKSCGVGVVLTKNEKMFKSFGVKVFDCIPDSNECEYRGIKEALKHVADHNIKADYIEIRTDSLNCASRISEGNVCHMFKELTGRIKANIAVKWNKGHAGIEFNEMADLLAKMAA